MLCSTFSVHPINKSTPASSKTHTLRRTAAGDDLKKRYTHDTSKSDTATSANQAQNESHPSGNKKSGGSIIVTVTAPDSDDPREAGEDTDEEYTIDVVPPSAPPSNAGSDLGERQ